MITTKIYDDEKNIFFNSEDAIKYLYQTNFEKEISVYDINSNDAYKKVLPIYEEIKSYNKRKELNEQILPSNPFPYRGIKGCLGVQAYSISVGRYKNKRGCICFNGYNTSVLDDSKGKIDIRPSLKALNTLAMLGGFIR